MIYAVAYVEALRIDSKPPLRDMYQLSPFVWRNARGYELLVRAVPHSDSPAEKIARVYHGWSDDGIHFRMADEPAIRPGPGEDDADGCEDPTLAIVDGTSYVYYTGWNERRKRGQLMLAAGPDADHLQKRGVALSAESNHENPKEATIVQAADGTWRLFFEYAQGGASKIGVAISNSVGGPWRILDAPFDAREDSWDCWHLSTGPICTTGTGEPVMFYNGAGRKADWRIGWVAFDDCYQRVIERCTDPIIAPPAQRGPQDTDIAFAASAVEDECSVRLYYSIADKDMYCATIRRL